MTLLPQFQIRRWLNNENHSGSAHVYGYIFDPKDGKMDAEFTVVDCNRTARLLFSVYDEQSPENVRHKIDQFLLAVIEYRHELINRLATLEKP